MFQQLRAWARKIKSKLFVLYFAYRHERTPWYAKVVALCVVAYAFSPIDLIPDFIPVLGYLDDAILVPLGVVLALKLLPEAVIRECTAQAEERMKQGKPRNWIAAGFIIAVWVAVAVWAAIMAYRYWIN